MADSYGGDIRILRTNEPVAPREVMLLTGHNDSVLSLDFNSDGSQLASASADGTVRLWDVGDLR
ncbi:WD40 repeat domain-containing protein [Streptomyces sp. NPDC047061]|uniref:WD40 repeat domain-containing protein n=1 Tax=Streptomyces sp. NPDC047061 TaxID=3154605 RepID=UPI0033E9668A